MVTGVYAQTGDVFLKCVELDASLAHPVQGLEVLAVSLVYESSAADFKCCDCCGESCDIFYKVCILILFVKVSFLYVGF